MHLRLVWTGGPGDQGLLIPSAPYMEMRTLIQSAKQCRFLERGCSSTEGFLPFQGLPSHGEGARHKTTKAQGITRLCSEGDQGAGGLGWAGWGNVRGESQTGLRAVTGGWTPGPGHSGAPGVSLQGLFQKSPSREWRSAWLEGQAGLGFTWTMSRSASFPREEIRTSSPSSSTMAVGGGHARE